MRHIAAVVLARLEPPLVGVIVLVGSASPTISSVHTHFQRLGRLKPTKRFARVHQVILRGCSKGFTQAGSQQCLFLRPNPDIMCVVGLTPGVCIP